MGFLPIAPLTGKSGATFLNPKEPEFRLDFLTTRHRGGDEPFFHPQLNVALQPLPFMEFSLEHVEQAVVFSRERAVLVNVPDPARFALHKLIVYGERTGSYRAKASKDLSQSASLLAYLWEHQRRTVTTALDDLHGRGKGWTSRFVVGAHALMKSHPELGEAEGLASASHCGSTCSIHQGRRGVAHCQLDVDRGTGRVSGAAAVGSREHSSRRGNVAPIGVVEIGRLLCASRQTLIPRALRTDEFAAPIATAQSGPVPAEWQGTWVYRQGIV